MNMPKITLKKYVSYRDVFIIYLLSFLILWILPFLIGKYTDGTFPYVNYADINKELVGMIGPTKDGLDWCPTQEIDVENSQIQYDLDNVDFETNEFAKQFNIKPGGIWEPEDCQARYKVVLIVPYRARDDQLKKFLFYMHPFLQKQQLDYRIVVVEQNMTGLFNRGKLFNVGFMEAEKLDPSLQCIIFHDVDLLPLSYSNIYACTHQPRHMYSALDTFRFTLPYRRLFGGAIAMQSLHFRNVNGFSNVFAGWGGEDDDMYSRLEEKGLHIIRFDPSIASYIMMDHIHAVPSPNRWKHLSKSLLKLRADGLTNLNYTINKQGLLPLYSHYLVTI